MELFCAISIPKKTHWKDTEKSNSSHLQGSGIILFSYCYFSILYRFPQGNFYITNIKLPSKYLFPSIRHNAVIVCRKLLRPENILIILRKRKLRRSDQMQHNNQMQGGNQKQNLVLKHFDWGLPCWSKGGESTC